MKRKLFLETFLGALGAVKIIWGDTTSEKIYGTAIYNETNAQEQQDFVWHMTEENVPSEDVKTLIKYISDNHLLELDKIIKPIDKLDLDFLEHSKKEKVIDELFNVEVRMVDEGEETDRYFIHN
jgi:hypothetical protein